MSFSSFNWCTPSVVHHQNGKEKLDAHHRMIYGMGEHRSRLFLLLSSLDLPHHHPFSPAFPGRLERTDLQDVTSILASLFSWYRLCQILVVSTQQELEWADDGINSSIDRYKAAEIYRQHDFKGKKSEILKCSALNSIWSCQNLELCFTPRRNLYYFFSILQKSFRGIFYFTRMVCWWDYVASP